MICAKEEADNRSASTVDVNYSPFFFGMKTVAFCK